MADKKIKVQNGNEVFVIPILIIMIFALLCILFIGTSYAEFVGDGNPVITGANTGRIIGELPIINLTGNDTTIAGGKTGTTISGVSAYGGVIRGNSASEVTAIMTSAVKGMNCLFNIDRQTSISGATANVLFEVGDTIRSQSDFEAGASKYQLSGTTNAKRLILFASATSEWTVIEVGSPTIAWD